MEVIIRSAMRLKDIIEDMAAIAHKEEGLSRVRRKPFSISKLVGEIVNRFEDAATQKNIRLSSDVPSKDPLMLEGDKEKIGVALSNLVQNAITFTDPGGQIGIKAEASNEYVKVYVVDTGIGIPAEDVERVFDRFYQAGSIVSGQKSGTGLGLSICRGIIQAHGGKIWVESKPGEGSKFTFSLPVSRKDEEID